MDKKTKAQQLLKEKEDILAELQILDGYYNSKNLGGENYDQLISANKTKIKQIEDYIKYLKRIIK